jgi:hypothetical protein
MSREWIGNIGAAISVLGTHAEHRQRPHEAIG